MTKQLWGAAQIDTIALGDLNNDKILDTAFVYTPPTKLSINKNGDTLVEIGCWKDDCFNRVTFSAKFPELIVANSVWGQIESIDDLNDDGINEILFASNWFTTTRSNLYLFSLKNGKWDQVEKVSFRNGENSSLKNQFVQMNDTHYLIELKNVDGDETKSMKEIKIE